MKLILSYLSIGLASFCLIGIAETRCKNEGGGTFVCRDDDSFKFVPTELEKIYGVGSQESINIGRQQVEQSYLLRQEALKKMQAENQRAESTRQYELENNALRLENLRLKNEALARENAEVRKPYGSEGVTLSVAQYERLQRITDDELSRLLAQGRSLSSDSDPVLRSRGERLLQFARLATEIRQKR